MEEAKLVAASAIALAVTLFSIFSLRPVARRLGLVDKPGGRKAHKGRVPLIGGLCFFLGTVAGLTYLGYVDAFVASLLVPCALIVMTGAVDDLNNMSVRSRLIIQACTAWLVIGATGIYLDSAGHLLGEGIDLQLGLLGVPITIVAVIGLVNAFNMMDGIDGLAAGMAMVSIGTILLFAGGSWPALGVVLLLQVLFAALVPYLAVNLGWPDGRKIFMGDAGSTLIGFLMAWSLIYLSHGKVGVLAPVDTLWCIAIPVMDTIGVMHRRMRLGRSPFEPDRQHLHHLLCDAGFSARGTLGIIVFAGLLLGGLGYALRDLPEMASLAAFGFVFALYLARLPQAIQALGRTFAKAKDATIEHQHVPAAAVFASTPALVEAASPQPGVMRALCVLSASSDAAQIAPIAEQMARDGRFETRLCIAASDEAPSEGVLGLFDLASDVRVKLADADGVAQVTSAALGTLDRVLTEFRPDVVVVPAGAPTSVATTLAATYQHIPVACVEAAGAPASRDAQDAARKVMGSLAAMHFTATESVGRLLVADGVPSDRVVVTGDPAARTLLTAVDRLHEDEPLQRELTQRFGFLRENAPLLLVSGREKMGERLEPLARALRRIALRRPDLDIVCLLPPSRNMDGIDGMLGAFANIHLVAPGDYTAFAYLADAAYLTLATAGDCAAEAAPLGKPVLLLNAAGEPGLNASPLTSEMPNVRRIDVHEQTISDVVLNLMTDRRAWEMLRNDERPRVDACERIVEALAAMRPSPATVVPLVPAAGLPRFAAAERVRGVS
jgi:undecaprenyl-phosphate alpha-N-acetylglucosaminyl 1-phosphatetransferase/UDP-N-acetylglucosamine 2-epimerase